MKTIKQFCYLCLAAIISAAAWACSADEISGSIAGSVSDRTTGDPVSAVSVTIKPGGASTVTGSDGAFTFRDLEKGNYTLTIKKEGYKDNSFTVSVRADETTSAHLLIERIPAVVVADREVLDFGENASNNTMSFNIVNSGYVDMAWEIEERCDWITEVKPEKGTLKYGETEGIVVVIDRQKLDVGENKAIIVIRSSQGSSQINVIAIGAEGTLPSLNTLDISDITSNSATFKGEILNAGEPEYTERGFVYSTSDMPTLDNTLAKITCPVNSNKVFSYKISSLLSNQKYYVRAYAINSKGIAYSSNQVVFTTSMTLPEVKTLSVVNPSFMNGTATFQGEITKIGDPSYVERGFVYGTLPGPSVYDNKIQVNGAGVLGQYSVYATSLPKEGYYVRAYALSDAGIVYGEEEKVMPEWIEFPEMGIAVQTKDVSDATYDYDTAKSLCLASRVGNFANWRLPSVSELVFLYANKDKIGGFAESKYWSSECDSRYNNNYYSVDFYDGNKSTNYYTSHCRVRAVRSI